MTKKYEKTQPRNPHQLTIKQHCFPRKSIARFANDGGLVHVHLVGPAKTVSLKPDDANFCALRVWDQRAESGFMKDVEGAYQDLADKIADGKVVRRLRQTEKQAITDMYVLWHCRWHWNKSPVEDQKLNALDVLHNYSKNEQELLEKEHITVIKPDRTISGRHFTGGTIFRNFNAARKNMRNCSWGILVSRSAGFIVPDNASNRFILPVTPSICLDNGEGYRLADKHTVTKMNEISKKTSEKYYFGRSL